VPPARAALPVWLGAALVAVALAMGCAGSQLHGPPIMPDVLPTSAPATLLIPTDLSHGPVVVSGDDGFLYLAGLEQPKVGDAFALRYGGRWDTDLGERPLLGLVRVARVLDHNGGTLALAQPDYLTPNLDLDGAFVQAWQSAEAPHITKGLATVTDLDGKTVSLDRGFFDGVAVGDRYIVLAPAAEGTDHLGDRLHGILMITRLEETAAFGEVLLEDGIAGAVDEGDWALFANPGIAEPPLPATIDVCRIIDGDEALRGRVLSALTSYLAHYPAWSLQARASDAEFDPMSPGFGAPRPGDSYRHEPSLSLAGKVVTVAGRQHLVLNYANSGLSAAHGMVAATPEMAFDVGPIEELDPNRLTPAFHALLAAILTHRGQNAEALYILETTLRSMDADGPVRWHLRDQLAMRWVQAGQLRQALRLVMEDIGRARALSDPYALVNAVGTIYALYEELGLDGRAVDSAQEFYEARRDLGEGPNTDHALRAFIETLFKAGRRKEAQDAIAEFEGRCAPEVGEAQALRRAGKEVGLDTTSCVFDLHYLYLSGYWSVADAPALQADYRDRALNLAYLLGNHTVASVRIVQAIEAVRRQDFDGATIAFLEAERLFDKDGYSPGVARVHSLRINLYIAQEAHQKAYDAFAVGADHYARAHDVGELAGLYRSIARLYLNVPPHDLSVASYVRVAASVLSEALKLQLGANDLGSAAEIYYISGRFRLGGDPQEADALLTRATELAVRVLRFDIAALSVLTRAMVARARGAGRDFFDLMQQARRLAELSGDAELLQTVIRAEQGGEPDRPTL